MASGENGNRHDILQNGDKPDVLGLKSLYADFASQCQPFASRAQKNARIRFCEWEGQSPDGRKHGSLRKPAYPWNGASDTRTYTADAIINENVALRLNALSLGAVKAVPVGFSDPENAAVARELIKWLTSPAKMPELRSELSMLANFAEEQGAAVLGFYWERKTETRVKIASAQEVAELSQNAAQWLALSEDPVLDNGEIAAIAQIEQAKTRAAEELSATLSISDKDAEKLLDQCRERGAGKYPSVEIVSDRPRVRAFRIGADILVPSDIDDLQNAPAIFTVEFMRPHELREKSKSEGWDAKWVEKIVECCVNGLPAEENSPRVAAYDKVSADASYADTVKIATAYYRARDSRGDVRLCYAIFAPDYDESGVAKAGRLEYEPSRLPFEAFRRETVSRKILDSRGSPEILEGWQRDVKTQRDSRNDKTSLEANPPRYYAAGRAPEVFGPGAAIPLKGGSVDGIIREAQISPLSQASLEIETSANAYAGSYFGKATKTQTENEAAALRQKMVDDWLEFVSRAYLQIYWLHRQFGPEVERVALSSRRNAAMDVQRGQLDEKYTFYISYDVRTADADYVLETASKLKDLIIGLDRSGRVNTDVFIQALCRYLCPDIADEIIVPQEDSDRREILETQSDIAKIASGQGVNAPEKANAQLRLQILQTYASQPDVAERVANDEFFRERLDAYTRQLQFSMQQAENAVIGRLGAAPQQFEPADMEETPNG